MHFYDRGKNLLDKEIKLSIINENKIYLIYPVRNNEPLLCGEITF